MEHTIDGAVALSMFVHVPTYARCLSVAVS